MRLAWMLLVALVVGCSADTCATPPCSTTPESTPEPTTYSTTPENPIVEEKSTTTGEPDVPVDNTASTVTGDTDAPVPTDSNPDGDKTDETEDPNASPKTTAKVVATSTTTTKKPAGSTTTKEPAPNVESFTVTCDKKEPATCTYTMQVPGLDIDTYNKLIGETNDTQSAVDKFESDDFINLQEGVTQVFDDAGVTVDYVESQLKQITQQIGDLDTASTTLKNDIDDVTDAIANANKSLTKILNKKGSCLYRQCVLKETTTPRPTTTTTVRTTPTPFCEIPANKDVCANDGTCNTWYDSYYCTCVGNLDGQDENCDTSVCDAIKTPQAPGLVVSPGYFNDSYITDEGCDDGAQWTIKGIKAGTVFSLKETENDFKVTGNTYIAKLTGDANLQLTVGKYKLKITSKTKWSQITQILGYGATATISYSGPPESFFHFTIVEVAAPTTTGPTTTTTKIPAPGS